jgi:hypothetical protein
MPTGVIALDERMGIINPMDYIVKFFCIT